MLLCYYVIMLLCLYLCYYVIMLLCLYLCYYVIMLLCLYLCYYVIMLLCLQPCYHVKLVVERSCIHHWLCGVVSAEHHEQVAHHSGFLVVVQLYYVFRG